MNSVQAAAPHFAKEPTMKVFLTGGTGFIGQPLIQRLLEKYDAVSVLVRAPQSGAARQLQAQGATLIPGDVTDVDSMRAGMMGADLVVHNAAWYELGVNRAAKMRMQHSNVTGTDNVLRLAHELEIPRVVYVSSCVAFGETGQTVRDESFTRQAACVSQYEQSKTDAHAIAVEYQRRGLPLVIVCPGVVIGPNDHAAWGYFARMYVNGIMPPVAWAKNAAHPQATHNDTAEGIVLAAEKGRDGELYHLGGELVSLGETFAIWSTPPRGFRIRLWLPTLLASGMFRPMESLQRWMGLPAIFSSETAVSAALNLRYSNAKAKQELGWYPRPPQEIWPEILEEEYRLKSARQGGGLAAKLRPLPIV
jgi:dihydroflavonol-4-reductase